MAKTYKNYYEKPTQVMWCDSEGQWESGIAYEDYVICACCGAVNLIEEIEDDVPWHIKSPIYEYNDWVNISAEIGGGDYPPEFFGEEQNED